MSPLLNNYRRDASRYQELVDDSGAVRPHWRRLFNHLERSTPAQLLHRQDLVARQIQENGITYNVYADPKGADRPWELDLIPQLIPDDEWQQIAAGIAQRASLLNGVLADIYGDQNLIREGFLPPDLVFGHNNFLWPCQGIQPPEGRFLHVYAADLARSPDGRWWVIADRTQAPSGAGYALENRQIIARAFPDLYRQMRVQPISSFFSALADTLARIAPIADGETPLVVVLTPGRYNETYFEHLYLARHLGYPLVEGTDLTVRDATLFLKTVGGLKRVHGVLRRLDDDYCDPLELRNDSALGIPGLLDAVRQGRVVVANSLGSGVLESPGLLGFLPKISERLLGEPLLLPQIATWWCGEEPVLEEAIERLADLVIKPAFPSQSFEPVFGASLSETEREKLANRLRACPGAYVAQELVKLSQAPIWQGSQQRRAIASRAIGMRVFAVATEDGYRVMPGGLTRVAHDADAGVVSMQRGGASKDTWILAEQPVTSDVLLRKSLGVRDLIRRDEHLPSRVVENLFWFGRYSERCDDNARLLRAALTRFVDSDGDERALTAGLAVASQIDLLPPGDDREQQLLTAILDPRFGNSMPTNLQRMADAAAQVRGRLSQENWRAVAGMNRQLRQLDPANASVGDALAFLNNTLVSLTALSGYALDDMTRDIGWRFLMLGRRVERLQFLATAIGSVLRSPSLHNQTTQEWMLELANSTITYRTRYLTVPHLIPVLDLLLLDAQNPHAVLFQMEMIHKGQEHLAIEYSTFIDNPLAECEAKLRALDLANLEPSLFGSEGLRDVLDGLADLMSEIGYASGQLSERIALRYFAHVEEWHLQRVPA